MTIRRALIASTAVTAVLTLAACSGSSGGGEAAPPASTNHKPMTITMWSGFTDRELGILGKTVDTFHASHPWITVKNVGGVDDDKIIKSIRAATRPTSRCPSPPTGSAPTAAAAPGSTSGPTSSATRSTLSQIPKVSADLHDSTNGTRCAMPALADVYGLYYNTDLLKKAGYTEPPKTATELLDMAIKMTTYNADGSDQGRRVRAAVGLLRDGAGTRRAALGRGVGRPTTASATSPRTRTGRRCSTWQKKFVDAIGYDKLQRFTAGRRDRRSSPPPTCSRPASWR